MNYKIFGLKFSCLQLVKNVHNFFSLQDQDVCLVSDKGVSKFIRTKISEGYSVKELKLLVMEHVKHILFKDRNQPPHYNTHGSFLEKLNIFWHILIVGYFCSQ